MNQLRRRSTQPFQGHSAIGGTGPVSGTLKHSFVKKMAEEANFGQAEVSFLERRIANYGTKGSIRVDFIFGNAMFGPSRFEEIVKALPKGFKPPIILRP